MNVIKTYLLNSSFHGVPFIVDNRYHWTERLFWVLCVLLSWWASVYVMISYYGQFLYGAISFTVDTSYLNWKSNFPAIVFCEKGNSKYNYYLNEWFGNDRDFDTDDIVKDIIFFKGILQGASYNCKSQVNTNSNSKNCLTGNYSVYSDLVRSKCDDIFHHCLWNNKKFSCCDQILPIETIYGVCYALNSLGIGIKDHQHLQMNVRHKLNLTIGTVSVELLNPDLKIFILSREEVPSYSEGTTLVFDGISTSSHFKEENNIYLSVEEMVNEKEVKSTSITRRGCIFPEENYLKSANVYSYTACMVECLARIQIETCQCNHHLMPRAKNICDIDGLICLSLNFEIMMEKSETCDCDSSCTEMNIKVIGSTTTDNYTGFTYESSITKLNFILRAPTVRYIRKVVNGYLDLIVSFGGTAGLCVGASLLTTFEIVYYLCIRPLSDRKKEYPNKIKVQSTFVQHKKCTNPPFPFIN